MVSKRSVEITYADTDLMGVVYHARYIEMFEKGRAKYLKDMGYDMKFFENLNLVFPIVNINVDYKYPTKYLDDVYVETKVINMSKFKTTYEHNVYANGKHSVKGIVTVTCVDKDSFKLVNLEKLNKEFYDKYKGAVVNG